MPKKKRKYIDKKTVDQRGKTRKEIRVERFILEQLDEYIRLHKEHEKDLSYIG